MPTMSPRRRLVLRARTVTTLLARRGGWRVAVAGIMKHCCRVSVSLGGVLSPHPLGVLAACLPPRPPTALLLCWAFEQLILVRLTTLALSPSPHLFAFCIARLILWGGDSLAARTWPQWFGCWGIPTCRWWWRRSSSTCATRCGTVR